MPRKACWLPYVVDGVRVATRSFTGLQTRREFLVGYPGVLKAGIHKMERLNGSREMLDGIKITETAFFV